MLRRAEAACSTELTQDLAFAVLADYERYPEWVPGLTAARILAREGDVVVLEVRAPRFRGRKVVLELIHSPPAEILFHEVGRQGEPGIAGRCELSADDGGTRVRLELRAKTPLLRLGSRRRLRGVAAGALEALAERSADLKAGRMPPPGGKRKILEIREHDGHLEIRLRQERYRLVRVSGEGKR